ncbi:LVIVD repeat-containing protein [Portibacter marinus]|uniref:hypothetical protein n=1 Tax=Portibacter marinus TaxID=2898660 RepID=UPI001F2DADC3|nr:hypothetical protein [Portibacter marinus]
MKLTHLLFASALFLLISCEVDLGISTIAPSDTNTQGSYANMIVLDNLMYVITKEDLQTYSLENPENPELIDEQFLGFNIESLLHYKGNLFVGSPQAMYIYEIDTEGIPRNSSITDYTGFGADFCQRDPIAVNDETAFASLSSIQIGQCREVDRNEIRVFNIENINHPKHINTVQMESPRGITLDGDLLFICEANNGLKVMDVSDPTHFIELYHFEGFKAYDVIANDGLLVVVGPEKIYEYDYSDINDMRYLSQLDF